MADAIEPGATAAPAAPAVPADAVPVAALVAIEAAAPAVAETTAAPAPDAPAPAPAEPVAPVEAAPAPETVLGEAPKPAEEPKPEGEADKAPEGEAPKTDAPSDDPAPLPVYDAFALPDNVTVADERMGQFTNLLGEFERDAKADHASVQTLGQKLVDFHLTEVQDAVQKFQTLQMENWGKMQADWLKQTKEDPEIGGNRFDTAVNAALGFIRTHGGTDEQQAEFRSLMNTSGLGNHPAMIRLLAKAGMAMSEGKPLAAASPPPAPRSNTQRLYGGKS